MKKVAVAMSGGVDSGIAAALLTKQGYQVTGFHMKLWHEQGSGAENKCCSTESLLMARRTAHQLGLQFYVRDLSKIFKKQIVDYFLKAYAAGLTPNPCVACNKFIKFGELLDYVRKLGFDFLATGHYARIKNGHLLQAKDKKKDQTYFLYNLNQDRLAHLLFPVGEYTKKQVREMAKKMQLPMAQRPESQEICFFPETDYRPFLKRQIPLKIVPGQVADTQGKVIGRHKGILLYTIGQRHGFEITNSKALGPWYVIGKDVKNNRLIVGFGEETEKREFHVDQVNLVNPNILISPARRRGRQYRNIKVRIRHQGELLKAKLRAEDSKLKVILDEPERGVAPGQSAVFYEDEEVLGGGIIV